MVLRIVLLIAMGVALAGCDKCGDFFWQSKSQTVSCKGGTGPSGT